MASTEGERKHPRALQTCGGSFLVVHGQEIKVIDLEHQPQGYPPIYQEPQGRRPCLQNRPCGHQSAWHSLPSSHEAWNGHTEIAGLLITTDADVNAKDGWEWTPLHIAANKSHKETIELLIAKGADVNALNNKSDTPLNLAVPDSPFDSTEIADLLRKHGGKTSEELKAEGK